MCGGHQFGSWPCHIDCECVVVISLGPGPVIWIVIGVVISLGPGPVIWIVRWLSVLVLTLGPDPVVWIVIG